MSFKFRFRPTGEKSFNKLPKNIQKQIVKKLNHFERSGEPMEYAEHLVNYAMGEYRFRVGDYRIITEIVGKTIYILLVGHRREIYKK